MAKIKQVFSSSGTAFLGASVVASVAMSGVISFLWGLLNDLTSLTILSLIAVNIPGEA